MHMISTATKFTHEQLLLILPMGTAYIENAEGVPCNYSITLAMALQAISAVADPYKIPETPQN